MLLVQLQKIPRICNSEATVFFPPYFNPALIMTVMVTQCLITYDADIHQRQTVSLGYHHHKDLPTTGTPLVLSHHTSLPLCTYFISSDQHDDILSNVKPLKLVNPFIYLGSNISSIEASVIFLSFFLSFFSIHPDFSFFLSFFLTIILN